MINYLSKLCHLFVYLVDSGLEKRMRGKVDLIDTIPLFCSLPR